MIKKILKTTLIVLFWLCVWQIISMAVGLPLLFPSPIDTVKRLFGLCLTLDFYHTLCISILRILAGAVSAIIFGVLLAMLTAKVRLIHDFISPLMAVIKVVPVVSFIILLLLWTGRDILPAIISALIVLPIVWSNVEVGILQTDRALLDMARVYKMSAWKRVKHIYIPSVFPYFVSALGSALGRSWKAGIAAEVIALPLTAIGIHIYEARLYNETTDLFAWTLALVLISLIIERLFVLAIKKLTARVGGEVK